MTYIRSSLLPNSTQHQKLVAPVVSGLSLAPVSKQAFDWCRVIGGNPTALTAEAVTAELLAIVEAAKAAFDADNKEIIQTIEEARANVASASKLANLPVVGDEVETIKGMHFAAERRASASAPTSTEISNAAFLARVLDDATGLDTDKLRASLDALDAEKARRIDLVAELKAIAGSLSEIADTATIAPDADQVVKIKIGTKMLRAAPAVLADLKSLRASVTEISDRLDSAIHRLEAVA